MSDFFTGPVPGQQPAAPASPPPPPQWPGSAPGGWPTPPPGGSGMTGGMKALLVVGIVVGCFVVIGIMAAVAIPVFLNQRAKAEAAATKVVIPEQLLGMTRMHDARAQQIEQSLRSPRSHPTAAVYGANGAVRASIAITKARLSNADDDAFLGSSEVGWQSQGFGAVTFTNADSGRLGGKVRCATVNPNFSVCIFADHGAYGTVAMYGAFAGRDDVALAIRESVEHRS